MALFQPHGSLQLNTNHRKFFHTWCARESLFYYGSRVDNLRPMKQMCSISPLIYSMRHPSSIILSDLDCDFGESTALLDVCTDLGTDVGCIDYRRILHESAKFISTGLSNHESSKNYPKLSKAWVGVDPDAWQGHIAYKAAVYALLKAVLALGELFNEIHPLYDILSPKIQLLLESLDDQLIKRDQELVKWFKMEQLPALTKCVTLALERCASLYVSSGNAVINLATNCCVSIKKMPASRISCPAFTMSLRDTIWELMESSPDFASVERVHCSITKLELEHEFLTCFGPKVLDHDARGNIIFWMGLLHDKLVAALCRESVTTILQLFCHSEIAVRDLAVIGLFAFLGRKTRLYLAQMGIKDLEETVKDFICYLECGIIFLYPELSSVCVYQLFMDVVTEEITWLDLYAADTSTNHQERKRLKHHTIQAEKEIILSTVFGVCLDMFSSFAHYSEKTEQSPNPNLQAYLHVSNCLLTFCLEDYWAAYDRLRELMKATPVQFPEPVMHKGNLTKGFAFYRRKQSDHRQEDLKTNVTFECTPQHMQHKGKVSCSDKILEKLREAVDTKPHQNFFAKCRESLLSTTSDIYMGTQLLLLDFKLSIGHIQKRIFGQALTKREKKKIARTLIDFVCVIPIAILMLLPVTAIGHAAMLTVIKRYIPALIPSPYSQRRLDVLKQLKRAKKMKADLCSNSSAFYLGS